MSKDASAISGLTDEFLADKPLFADIADEFLSFVGDARLVIHNAKFDIDFLNSELSRLNKPLFDLENAVDTLQIVKRKFPGAPATLDALCKRFDIDTSARVTHGALVDCQLLAEVYINLLGGRQSDLSFEVEREVSLEKHSVKRKNKTYEARSFPPSEDEILARDLFLKKIKAPLWNEANL
jgi:DNA polymerase-3 subunit epsilon